MARKIAVYTMFWLVMGCSGVMADIPVRVATFNIQFFDPYDPVQLEAAAAILSRVGAEVVVVQEISDEIYLELLADEVDLTPLGYPGGYPNTGFATGTNTSSGLHTGIMSIHPITAWTETARSLSEPPCNPPADPAAKDITRNFIVAEVRVPGAEYMYVVGNHWKAISGDIYEFRRSVEWLRTLQVTDPYDSTTVPYLVMGDLNDNYHPGWTPYPQPFTEQWYNDHKNEFPEAYVLGCDIEFPVHNGTYDPFGTATGAQNLTVIYAAQKTGTTATMVSSSNRYDYIYHSDAVTPVAAEVYDSRDEEVAGGLGKYGSPLDYSTSDNASDHLLVFADINLPETDAGACCTGCGCKRVTQTECWGMAGEFLGAGTACSPDPCSEYPPPNDLIINEVLINHDGAEQDQEFIEIYGPPHTLLCGLSVLVIEGNWLFKGEMDWVFSLDDCAGEECALDENGYFVIGGSGLTPAADMVVAQTNFLEDGTTTFALVRDYTSGTGYDVDADNDGVEDDEANVGTLLDAIGAVDGNYPTTDAVYFTVVPPATDPADEITVGIPGGARCPDGVDSDVQSDWVSLGLAMDGSDGCVPSTPGQSNTAYCGGDYDGDGDLDLIDFAVFQQCFGSATLECAALNLDGQCGVSLDDFAIFVSLLEGP
ncbi:MAG: endonuclease/exonuclease/phosphatase family protein [Phycisphaerae bacterium]|nr:endonuclease/exonuclease/phosphatase family protein [Phycisphaerae bacterium]